MSKVIYNRFDDIPEHLRSIAYCVDSGVDGTGTSTHWYELTEEAARLAGPVALEMFKRAYGTESEPDTHVMSAVDVVNLSIHDVIGRVETLKYSHETGRLSVMDDEQQQQEEQAENEGMRRLPSIHAVMNTGKSTWIGESGTIHPENDRMKELRDKYYQQLCDVLKEVNNKFFDNFDNNEFSSDEIRARFEKIRDIARG